MSSGNIVPVSPNKPDGGRTGTGAPRADNGRHTRLFLFHVFLIRLLRARARATYFHFSYRRYLFAWAVLWVFFFFTIPDTTSNEEKRSLKRENNLQVARVFYFFFLYRFLTSICFYFVIQLATVLW